MAISRVAQEDAEGCALATLAMITGRSYSDVKTDVDAWSDKPHDWTTDGCTFYTLDRYLASLGWFLQRRYESWGMPLEAFASIHYASVRQPSNYNHFVCVLEDGTVLDPLREGEFRLSDWEIVNQLVGLEHPLRLRVAHARTALKCGESAIVDFLRKDL